MHFIWFEQVTIPCFNIDGPLVILMCGWLMKMTVCVDRYDFGKTFAQNIELTDPILLWFDILWLVKVRKTTPEFDYL